MTSVAEEIDIDRQVVNDWLCDIEQQNKALWEFFDAWVFFHATKAMAPVSETLDRTRQETAAQMLVDAANRVKELDGRTAGRSH